MRRPNILLLFSDEHSFRFMGHVGAAEGVEPIATPAFDALAAGGTRFSDAYCQMPLCTPSRLCMLTGREVRGAGAWGNCDVLRPELPTLGGLLRDAGYTTCLIGKMHLGGTQQFVGFQYRPYGDLLGRTGHQWEPLGDPRRSLRDRTATAVGETMIPESRIQDEVVAAETVAFLREQAHRRPDTPWLLCAGFSRPHFPLTAPRRHLGRFWPDGVTDPKVPAAGDAWDHPMSVGMRAGFRTEAIDRDEMMYARACYFACVSYLDEILGDLFARLDRSGLLEDTIILYTSDHGEMAGEHGMWWKNGWYEACTRVPLIVSTPQQRRGEQPAAVCRTPVGLVDLLPTLTALAGATTPDDVDGADLSAVVTGTGEPPERPIVCDNLIPRWGAGTEFRMVRRGRYKVVIFRDAPPLAFDLADDPGEQHNLLARADGPPAAVRDLLGWAAESIDFDAAERERTERDGNLKQQYAQGTDDRSGNCFHMPNGIVVNADDTLYHPEIIADDPTVLFGNDWQNQNKHDV